MTVIRSGALRPGPLPHISYNIRTTDPRLYALGRSALAGPGDRTDPRVSAWRGRYLAGPPGPVDLLALVGPVDQYPT